MTYEALKQQHEIELHRICAQIIEHDEAVEKLRERRRELYSILATLDAVRGLIPPPEENKSPQRPAPPQT